MSVSPLATARPMRIEGPGLPVPPDARDLLCLHARSMPPGIARLLGPPDRLIALLNAVADWRHVLIARDPTTGRAIGLVGLRSTDGSFLNGLSPGLPTAYGALGARWRSALLNLLERQEPAPVLLIDGIAVVPDEAGRGVGRALIGAALAEASRRDLEGVCLDVDRANHAARAFYAACGFQQTGRHRYGPAGWLMGVSETRTLTLYHPDPL